MQTTAWDVLIPGNRFIEESHNYKLPRERFSVSHLQGKELAMTDPKQDQKTNPRQDTGDTQEIRQIKPSHMNQGNKAFRPDPQYRPESPKTEHTDEQRGQKDTKLPEKNESSRQAS